MPSGEWKPTSLNKIYSIAGHRKCVFDFLYGNMKEFMSPDQLWVDMLWKDSQNSIYERIFKTGL